MVITSDLFKNLPITILMTKTGSMEKRKVFKKQVSTDFVYYVTGDFACQNNQLQDQKSGLTRTFCHFKDNRL